MLTAKRVRFLFNYYPQSGRLTRRIGFPPDIKEGDEVGYIQRGNGSPDYLRCKIDGQAYLVHRVIWLHQTGKWPEKQIDHIDHNGLNNSWENLREADGAVNSKNRKVKSNNRVGVTGIHWHKRTKQWVAKISHNCEVVRLGYFKSIDDAVAARKAAEKQYGYHENHGRDGEIDRAYADRMEATMPRKVDREYVALMEATRGAGAGLKRKINPLTRKLPSSNKSGVAGVHYSTKTRKWLARISIDGKRKALGSFDTKDEAVAARRQAEAELRARPEVMGGAVS